MIRHDGLPDDSAATSEFTASVLIIQDDADVRTLYGHQLAQAGFDGTVADPGNSALAPDRPRGYAAVLLDVHIPDIVSAALAGTPASTTDDGPVVVMNGRLTVRVTIETVTREASARPIPISAGKPRRTLPPPRQIGAATSRLAARTVQTQPHSTAHRWASYVLSICLAPHDIRTLDDWARHVGTSHTTLGQICRILAVRPHDARNLGRALFAIVHAGREHCPPTVLLDIADTRTLRVFLRQAGPDFRSAVDIDDVNRFLDSQEFVEPQNQGLRILRELLKAHLSEDAALAARA